MTEVWWVVGAAGVLGLLLGSFLNVCALRWPEDQSVVRPRSRCPGCHAPVGWYDNLPVVSYLFLRGRCRRCREPISIQYPLVEMATGLIWAGLTLYYGGVELEAVRGALFLTLLLGIALSDARFYIIPDQFSVGGAVLGLAFAPLVADPSFVQALVGAVFGFVLLWLVAWAGERVFGQEAMGGGDIKMMAMVGAFLGPAGVVLTVFLGSLVGVLIFGPISYRTGKLVPFGIFLAVGAAVTYGWGDPLVDWYMGWATGG